ncbi:MAG: hypothetical protein CM1200mP30_19200 [Pseudomonadota bacterium]|nr:MAG: hypothetical protein CM1200mP30_19200 [Pseudomonadota bacterium]
MPGFCGPLTAEKKPHGQSNPTYIISSQSGEIRSGAKTGWCAAALSTCG